MRTSCPVVPDGEGHAVGNIFVDDDYGEQSLFPFEYSLGCFHDFVAVKTVHEFINILFRDVVTNAGHRVAVFPDG